MESTLVTLLSILAAVFLFVWLVMLRAPKKPETSALSETAPNEGASAQSQMPCYSDVPTQPDISSQPPNPPPDAVLEPCADLDHESVVASGGDYYGWHWLFKCPKCGHIVLHDFEHDYFYPDAKQLERRVSLASCGESHPCPTCGHHFVSDEIWQFSNAHRSFPDWLLTRTEVERAGLQHLLKKEEEPNQPPEPTRPFGPSGSS